MPSSSVGHLGTEISYVRTTSWFGSTKNAQKKSDRPIARSKIMAIFALTVFTGRQFDAKELTQSDVLDYSENES